MDAQKIYTAAFLGFFALFFLRRNVPHWSDVFCRPLARRVLRHLVYPRIFRSRQLFNLNPTRAEFLFHIVHWAATATGNAYGVHNLLDAGLRAGQMSIIHLLPLFAFRQLSSVADLFGVSLSLTYTVHRSIGIMASIQGVVHAVISLHGTKWSAADSILGLLVSTGLRS